MEENNLEALSSEMEKNFKNHYFIARDSSDKFSQLVWENPMSALNVLFKIYNSALNKAYTNSKTEENVRWLVESMTGGPHEAIPSALYNSVGAIYPYLDREVKNYALEKIFTILDLIRNDYIQFSHTSYIRDPLLLSDISIARPAYWPGLREGQNLISNHKLFCDFKSEFINEHGFFNKEAINSDFLVGYALLRKDICDWGEDYLEVVNSTFLDKIIQGVVGMRVSHLFSLQNLSEEEVEAINNEAKNSAFYNQVKDKLNKNVSLEIVKRKNRLNELLPQSLLARVDEKIREQDWTDYKLFMKHKGYLLKRYIDDFL